MKFNLFVISAFCFFLLNLNVFAEGDEQTDSNNNSAQTAFEQTEQEGQQDNSYVNSEMSEEEADALLEEAYQKAQEQAKLNDENPQKWEIKNAKKLAKQNKKRKIRHIPSKKIFYDKLDLSKQPKFNDEYCIMAQDVKRSDFKIPEPVYEKNPKFVVPDPYYRVVLYNSPPGVKKLELKYLYTNNKIDSQAVLSPDKSKLVYTSVYYYPSWHQTGYDAHYIKVKEGTNIRQALKNSYITQQEMKPIVSSLKDNLNEYKLTTLIPLDWSKDSSKIAFKEQVGSTLDGVWETNVIVYDFNTDTSVRLDTLREAVEYYWRVKFGIDLSNYMWDLYPLGWSSEDENRIVFYAYAFSSKSKSYFLGTWSIDWEENSSKLLSSDDTSVPVSVNGYGLQLIELSH